MSKKISWETLSVTSRRGPPTSRRQNYTSLPRRDVDLHVATSKSHLSVTSRPGISRRDVNVEALCHVATWDVTSRRHFLMPLSRRDVGCHVATWDKSTLCHIATSLIGALCHVATWPRTSRRDPVFSPRMVHFGPSPHTPSLIGTLAPLRTSLHRTCRSSHPTGRRPSTAHRPPVFLFESPSSAGFGS